MNKQTEFGGTQKVKFKKEETCNLSAASLRLFTEKSTSRCFFKGVSSCKPLGSEKSERRFFMALNGQGSFNDFDHTGHFFPAFVAVQGAVVRINAGLVIFPLEAPSGIKNIRIEGAGIGNNRMFARLVDPFDCGADFDGDFLWLEAEVGDFHCRV